MASDQVVTVFGGDDSLFQNVARRVKQTLVGLVSFKLPADVFHGMHQGFRGVETGAKGAVSGVVGLKNAFSELLPVIGGLLGAASVFEAFKKGIGQAAERETAGQRFATIAGGIDKVTEATERLEKASAETGTDFPELERGAQRLMQAGLSADDAADSIVRLNKVSLLTGSSLEELADIVARVQLKEEISAKDMAKLAAAGVPGIAAINKEFKNTQRSIEDSNTALDEQEEHLHRLREGLDVQAFAPDPEQLKRDEDEIQQKRLANAKKLQTEQRELLERVQTAFKHATDPQGALGNLNPFFNTFAGKLYVVKHDLDEMWEGFGAPLIDALKPIMAQIHSQFMPVIKGLGEQLGNALGGEITLFFNAFQTGDWSGVQKQFEGVMQNVTDFFMQALNAANWKTASDNLVKAFGQSDWSGVLNQLSDTLGSAGQIFLNGLGTQIGSLSSAFADVLRSDEVDKALDTFATNVANAFKNAFLIAWNTGLGDLGTKTFLAGPKVENLGDLIRQSLFPENVPLNKGWETPTPQTMPVPAPPETTTTNPMSDTEAVGTLGDILSQMTALNSNLSAVLRTA